MIYKYTDIMLAATSGCYSCTTQTLTLGSRVQELSLQFREQILIKPETYIIAVTFYDNTCIKQ